MGDSALFIGWGGAVRGRERQAMQVFGEAVGTWQDLQAQGKIDGFESVFLEPHGGDLAGFFLLRGDPGRLAALRQDDVFLRVISRANLIVENLGVVGAHTGAAVEDQMARFAAATEDLA